MPLILGLSFPVFGADAKVKGPLTPSQAQAQPPSSLKSPPTRPRVDISGTISVPESWGFELAIQPLPWGAFWFAYSPELPLRINYQVPGRRLVKSESLEIRSPDFTVPFDLNFGPHRAGGITYYPFKGAFFISLGYQRRTLTISGDVQSQLLFTQGVEQIESNTLFEARVDSRTEQRLIRFSLGHRWSIFEDQLTIGWFMGLSKPSSSRSEVHAFVQARNPQASNPEEGQVASLSEAETQQARHMEEKANAFLDRYQGRVLPLLGLSLGVRL